VYIKEGIFSLLDMQMLHQKVAGSAKVGLRTGPAAAQASMNTPKGFVAGKTLKKVCNSAYPPCMRHFYCQHSCVITFI
jgi:hypothetical protein